MDKTNDLNVSMTLRRELKDELGLELYEDYEILSEFPPIVLTQFSKEKHVFTDFEFHLFRVVLKAEVAEKVANEQEVCWAKIDEIDKLLEIKSKSRQAPVSKTTKEIFQRLGLLETKTSSFV